MTTVHEKSTDRERREEKERQYYADVEGRRLDHNRKVAELEIEARKIEAERTLKSVTITKIFLAPVIALNILCITFLSLRNKPIPKVMADFLK